MLGRSLVVLSMVLVAAGLSACAKRPNTTAATAPAPTGPSGAGATTPGAGPADATRGGGTSAARPTPGAGAGATARPNIAEFRTVADLKDVHFAYDRHDIEKSAAAVLDANAAWLRSHENELLLIEGHCDERGTDAYNVALGERRAKATMDYLVSRGIPQARITITSYGEERPQCRDHAEPCWTKNRRAHFLVKPR
jgi:peptidoglycan-associated lipoprotein